MSDRLQTGLQGPCPQLARADPEAGYYLVYQAAEDDLITSD